MAVHISGNGLGGTPEGLYYLLTDHLGSVTALADREGNIMERHSYDPWGRARNPADRSYDDVPDNTLLFRGFTGHEHYPEFSLINMNGRCYDPILGRFLSPDNYVQEPGYAQNYNRYTYCLNNPTKFVDPDGNNPVLVAALVGAAFGAFNGAMIADQAGAQGFWEWAGYIGGGALIGAASGYAGAYIGGSTSMVLGGMASGAIGGAGFTGLATNWNGQAMLTNRIIGSISGGFGGVAGGAIGGVGGVFVGGAIGSGMNTWLQGGSPEEIMRSAIIGGGISTGVYLGMSYYAYSQSRAQVENVTGKNFRFRDYLAMARILQRSQFEGKEFALQKYDKFGRVVNEVFPASTRREFAVSLEGSGNEVPWAEYLAHTHHLKKGTHVWVDSNGNIVAQLPPNASESAIRSMTMQYGKSYIATPYHGSSDYSKTFNIFTISRYGASYSTAGSTNHTLMNVWFNQWLPFFGR